SRKSITSDSKIVLPENQSTLHTQVCARVAVTGDDDPLSPFGQIRRYDSTGLDWLPTARPPFPSTCADPQALPRAVAHGSCNIRSLRLPVTAPTTFGRHG